MRTCRSEPRHALRLFCTGARGMRSPPRVEVRARARPPPRQAPRKLTA